MKKKIVKQSSLDILMFIFLIVLIGRDSFYFLGEFKNILYYGIYIYYIYRISSYIFSKSKLNNQFKMSKIILTLLILLLLSAFWSINISNSLFLTVKNLVMPFIIVTFMLNHYNEKILIKALFYSGLIITITSIFTVLFLPEFGTMTSVLHSGLWRGIYSHKNILGASLSIFSVLSFVLMLYVKKLKEKILLLLIFLVQLMVIYFAGSTTSLLTIAVVFIVMFMLFIFRKINNIFLFLSILLILFIPSIFGLLVTLYNSLESITTAFGKDLTFSGRIYIWEAVIDLIRVNPILGYGYGSFWDEGSETYNYVNNYVGWRDFTFNHAHNGFLDLLTSVGFIGFIIFFISVYIYIKRNILLIFKEDSFLNFIPCSFLVYFLTNNLQESMLLEQNFIMWILYCFFYIFLMKRAKTFSN